MEVFIGNIEPTRAVFEWIASHSCPKIGDSMVSVVLFMKHKQPRLTRNQQGGGRYFNHLKEYIGKPIFCFKRIGITKINGSFFEGVVQAKPLRRGYPIAFWGFQQTTCYLCKPSRCFCKSLTTSVVEIVTISHTYSYDAIIQRHDRPYRNLMLECLMGGLGYFFKFG